jgi:hypothetical protein
MKGTREKMKKNPHHHPSEKVRCYWEHPWGTHWERRKHSENT